MLNQQCDVKIPVVRCQLSIRILKNDIEVKLSDIAVLILHMCVNNLGFELDVLFLLGFSFPRLT